MDGQRDFKGIWIPKEIWLNGDLTLLEKAIFIEIDSLDNEEHCTAGNEYFARFCNCSESKVTKTIDKLQKLGMIEILSFNGRYRKIRVVQSTRQSRTKYEAESYKVRTNNINNNTNNNKSLSKDKDSVFDFGKPKQPQQNLYSKCEHHIREFSKDPNVIEYLRDFLAAISQMGKLRGEKQFISILKKLDSITEDPDKQRTIISYSLEKGYATFYDCLKDIKPNFKKDPSTDIGYSTPRADKTNMEENIKNGKYEKF